MPLILAFDTSAAHCAAALLEGDAILAERAEPMAKGQAERLMPMIAGMLEAAGLGWDAPHAIGVGIGPGNFTGVRIAVAAARGLAMARAIPAIGVSALEAAAYGSPPCLAAVPAGRGQIAVQAPGGAPETIPEEALAARAGRLPVIGWAEGAAPPAHPIAVAIARLSALRLGTPQPRPAPLYARPADAAPARPAPPLA